MKYGTIAAFWLSMTASLTDDQMTSELAVCTLKRVLAAQSVRKEELLLHSEQGTQYMSKAFADFCEPEQITQRMSKAGYPYDNAPMERHFNPLKNKCIHLYEFETEEESYRQVEELAYVIFSS